MADEFLYITEKVTQDDVAAAIESARKKAIAKLGQSAELYEKNWTPNWLCTTWRLKTADPVPDPH